MTLTYILRSFRRRKVRTLLMVLALTVGVGTLVALNATVDSYRRFFAGTVAGEVGAFDLVIVKKDTEPNPFLDPGRVVPIVEGVPGVARAAPRVHAVAGVSSPTETGEAPMVALDPERDSFGALELVSGASERSAALATGPNGLPGAIVLQETADVLDLEIGTPIEIRYAPPLTRLPGRAGDTSGARQRTTASWIVRAIATQRGVTGQGDNTGVIVGLDAADARFGLQGEAERVLVALDTALYEGSDPQDAAFAAREHAAAIRDALDDPAFTYQMPRPQALTDGANQFIFIQSLITMYGLLSLSVVGLLIRTLIMTNVREQTRDMAILRILGASRRYLFNLVAAEVAAVGVVGIGLGVVVGQAVNNLAIVPLFEAQASGMAAETPLVSPGAVLSAVVLAGIVLAVSALHPARRAAGTKVTHAINPGIAEGLGLEDLAKLRERRTDLRITGVGLVVLIFPLLIFFAFPLAFDFGILWVLAALFFGALLALIVGAALVFFVVILPMERLLLFVGDRLAPRVGYFVRRTVLRGKARNTLISLMIVMSATLPTFLSTQLALEVANTATDRRLTGGAPFRITAPRSDANGQTPTFRTDGSAGASGTFDRLLLEELRADPSFRTSVGLTASRTTPMHDGLGLRGQTVRAVGADGNLETVLYDEAIDFTAGDRSALARVVEEPNTVIIGSGLETYFNRTVGETLVLEGEGRDHEERVTIVGVAGRLGGVGVFSAKQTRVWSGESTVLMGAETWRRLTTDPLLGAPAPDEPVVRTLLAAPTAGADERELTTDLRLRYATEHDLSINSTAETIASVRDEARTGQLFLIVLTALTSVLAVFGVFAVIYVSIYGRRAEIGMLKAMGAPGRHLLATFVGEAMVMTLSATLTGVTAGVVLGYALRVSESFQQEVPTVFAFDTVVVPSMLVLMIAASLVSAVVATHSYRRMSAIEILRTVG